MGAQGGPEGSGSAPCAQAGVPRLLAAPGRGAWAACPVGDGAVCSYRPIVDYIDAQFENYLQEELKIRRSLFDYHDTRVHVCLYFITPTGHSLKSLDLVTMKKLDSKVCAGLSQVWGWWLHVTALWSRGSAGWGLRGSPLGSVLSVLSLLLLLQWPPLLWAFSPELCPLGLALSPFLVAEFLFSPCWPLAFSLAPQPSDPLPSVPVLCSFFLSLNPQFLWPLHFPCPSCRGFPLGPPVPTRERTVTAQNWECTRGVGIERTASWG